VVLSVGDMGNATLNGFAVVGGNADLAEYSRVHEENVMRNRGGGINEQRLPENFKSLKNRCKSHLEEQNGF